MLIMNCKKYAKKAKFQKMTWLPNIPAYLRYYHVIGDEALDTAFKFDDANNVLWVKVADDYNSLPKKVISAYEAVYDSFQFKYLFKTDDDQVLVKPQFFDTIKGVITSAMPPIHYGGYIVDVKQPYLSQYNKIHPELPSHLPLYATKYCSGRFYFLSKSAISSLINQLIIRLIRKLSNSFVHCSTPYSRLTSSNARRTFSATGRYFTGSIG